MAKLTLEVARERVRLAKPFRISGHVFDSSEIVVVTLRDGSLAGRGEGGGVYYLNDDAAHMVAELERVRAQIEEGPSREQ